MMLLALELFSNPAVWWTLGIAAAMFLGTLAVLPWIVGRMPADYFVRPEVPFGDWTWQKSLVRLVRNAIGIVLIAAGITMLVLPGQGVLTILVGVACLSFRGKRKLMRSLVYRRGVLRGLNWIREKRHLPPFCNDTGTLGLPHCPTPTSKTPHPSLHG